MYLEKCAGNTKLTLSQEGSGKFVLKLNGRIMNKFDSEWEALVAFDKPAPYQECVIKNKDGQVRIGRLNHKGTHWQIASFLAKKYIGLWADADVVAVREINMEL